MSRHAIPAPILALLDQALSLYPCDPPDRLSLRLRSGQTIELPLPPCGVDLPREEPAIFVPTAFQADLLAALEGKALTTDALAAKVGCGQRNLFRRPGGVAELKEQGLLASHPRLGYYRPDAPPPELTEDHSAAN